MISHLYFYLALNFFQLPAMGLELGSLAEYPIKKVGEGIYEISHGGRLIVKSVDAPNEGAGQSLMADGKSLVQGLYGAKINPYQGAISRETICEVKEAAPILTQDAGDYGASATFKLMANEMYVYGVCDTKDFAHRSFFKLLYCRSSKKFFRVKYFTSPQGTDAELDALADAVKCRG